MARNSASSRRRWRHHVVLAFALVAVAACTNVAQLRTPTVNLGAAMTTAADAQQAIYDNARKADANRQLAAVRQTKWLLGSYDQVAPPPASAYGEFEVRGRLLKTLRTYGQLMTAIATGTEDATLDANATALAASLRSLQANAGALSAFDRRLAGIGAAAPAASGTSADIVATAVSGLGDLIVDHAKAHELQQAANSVQPALQKIVAILERENEDIAASTASVNTQIDKIAYSFEDAAWRDKSAKVIEKYNAAIAIEADFAKLGVPADPAPMTSAWQAVLAANAAVVAQKADILGLAQEAYGRAQDSLAYYKGLAK